MESIEKRAKRVLAEKNTIEQSKQDIKNKKLADQIISLTERFEVGFADELPLLKSEKITYSLHYQIGGVYDSYVLFERKGRSLKMDFHSAKSYRLEFVKIYHSGVNPHYGAMQYGAWSKDDFIVFLYKGLINPEQPK